MDISSICDELKVDLEDIRSSAKNQGLVLSRHALYYILRLRYGLSYSEIGEICHKDHTSIMYGVGRFSEIKSVVDLTNEHIKDIL